MGYFDLKRFPLKGHVWERWVFFLFDFMRVFNDEIVENWGSPLKLDY